MKREDLVSQTRRLIEEGDRIDRSPSRAALNTWLAASDALLSEAWGSMDRYHLAWLEVGRIAQPLRGREISTDEEAQEIRSVVSAKGAVMRASLDAVERLGMPFLGETRRAPTMKRPVSRITCTKRHMDLLAARVHCSPQLMPHAKRRRRTKITRSTGRAPRRRAIARTSGRTSPWEGAPRGTHWARLRSQRGLGWAVGKLKHPLEIALRDGYPQGDWRAATWQ